MPTGSSTAEPESAHERFNALAYYALVVVEKCAARQKEIGNHRFPKLATLGKLTSSCSTMRKVLSDSGVT